MFHIKINTLFINIFQTIYKYGLIGSTDQNSRTMESIR